MDVLGEGGPVRILSALKSAVGNYRITLDLPSLPDPEDNLPYAFVVTTAGQFPSTGTVATWSVGQSAEGKLVLAIQVEEAFFGRLVDAVFSIVILGAP